MPVSIAICFPCRHQKMFSVIVVFFCRIKQNNAPLPTVADSTKEQPSLSPTPLLLRFPSSLQPQFDPPPPLPLLLCIFYSHAHQTGVEVARARHDASLGDHGNGVESIMAAMAMSRLVRMPPSTHRITRSRRPSQFFLQIVKIIAAASVKVGIPPAFPHLVVDCCFPSPLSIPLHPSWPPPPLPSHQPPPSPLQLTSPAHAPPRRLPSSPRCLHRCIQRVVPPPSKQG